MTLRVLAGLLSLATALGWAQQRPPLPPELKTAPAPLLADAAPARSCKSLLELRLENTTIHSAVATPAQDQLPPSCRIEASVTHPPAGDDVKIQVWLPAENWNGRFRGTGGGGFSGGAPRKMRQPLAMGFATASTDTGHEGGSGSFGLGEDGRLEWMLIRDNAYLGIHEMTVLGKALTEAFYGIAPRYSYFADCSTGGRQALMEAQRYPADYDGILSAAPAINWPKLHVAQLWGQLVMLEADNFVAPCKFEAANQAAVADCDLLDKVADSVLEDPRACDYDPQKLVGKPTECGNISAADADVIRRIWQGPRRRDGSFIWYGLPRGTPFRGLNQVADGKGSPFRITLEWFRYYLTQDPDWDWTTITQASYEQFWDQSNEQFGAVLATDNPDLAAFRDRGGKAIVWHGWADPLIFAEGTIDYYEKVRREMGEGTDDFVRLFMAPGVTHCRGGPGPQLTNHFQALMDWVEADRAPDRLEAVRLNMSGKVVRSRPLCPYPLVATYQGAGDPNDASNFQCSFD